MGTALGTSMETSTAQALICELDLQLTNAIHQAASRADHVRLTQIQATADRLRAHLTGLV